MSNETGMDNPDRDLLVRVAELFINRPDISGTVDGLASRLGRSVEEVRPVIALLVRAEVINESAADEPRIYQYRYVPPLGSEMG